MNEVHELADPVHLAARPPSAIAEYLSSMQSKAFSKLTKLELQDRLIPGTHVCVQFCVRRADIDAQAASAIADTTTWTGSRTSADLVEFIIQGTPFSPRQPFRSVYSFCKSRSSHPSCPIPPYAFISADQVCWCTYPPLPRWRSPPCYRCDSSSQIQDATR